MASGKLEILKKWRWIKAAVAAAHDFRRIGNFQFLPDMQ